MIGNVNSEVNDHNLKLCHTVSPNFKTINFHAHDGYEILYFLAGEVQYYIEDKSYYLVPGDILVIPPGRLHRPVIIDENTTYDRMVLSVSVDYCRRLMERVTECFVWKDIPACRIPLDEKEKQDFSSTMNKMMALKADIMGVLERDCFMTLVLLQLHRFIERMPQGIDAPAMRMQQVIRFINVHFTEQLSLDDIAERFFISKFHLLRQFKSYTNSTVHNYILAKRVLLAKALLKEGIAPSEVCQTCGFGSYAGFYQAFFQDTGKSPSQFLRENSK